jgi:hypothetical protein
MGSSARAWCRTPRTGLDGKAPRRSSDRRGAILLVARCFYGEVTWPFKSGSYSSLAEGRLWVSASFIASRWGL